MTVRRFIAAMLAALFLAPVLARADEAPPPDPYEGQPPARIAGLVFEHQRIEAKLPNCIEAKKRGAVGGAVVKVDGVAVGDDVHALKDALGSGKHVLTLVAASDVIVQPDDPKEISLSVSVP